MGLSLRRCSGDTAPFRRDVLLRRVLAAREAISAGATLTEAAYRCGGADLQHVTRTFGRFVGVTPGAFRAGVGA